MADDLKLSSVSSSAKATILAQNDGVPACKFEGELAKYTVEQLKRLLKCRGIKQTGKTVPHTPWKAFPSQDLSSLINYGLVYHYALESWPTLPGEKNYNEEDEDEEFTRGIGHMTVNHFLMDVSRETRNSFLI